MIHFNIIWILKATKTMFGENFQKNWWEKHKYVFICLRFFQYSLKNVMFNNKKCQTLKIGTTTIKLSVQCSIRDVISCNSLWSMDAFESKSRLRTKEGCIHDNVQACNNFINTLNGPRRWSHKCICKPLKTGILNHHKQKLGLVEKNEKPYII